MNPATTIDEIMAVPFYSQFTREQIIAQVKKSAEGVRIMHTRAIRTGKKVGGFTAQELDTMALRYENMI